MTCTGLGRRRTAALACALVLTASGLAACSSSGDDSSTPSSTVSVDASKKLTIGISFDQPGMGLKDGDTYKGFDVDTATYVARQLGVSADNITWIQAIPSDRENLIINGTADMVLSTYTITDERKQKVDFAGPYFLAHQDLLIRRNDEDITDPKTLDKKKLCSVTGTTSAKRVTEEYAGRIDLRELSTFSDCVKALASGDVDAVTTDDVILAGFAAEPKYKGILKVLGKGFSDEPYGIAVKKGDTELVTKINAALKQYISDGSWKKSLDKYVAPSGYSIPDPPTPGD